MQVESIFEISFKYLLSYWKFLVLIKEFIQASSNLKDK